MHTRLFVAPVALNNSNNNSNNSLSSSLMLSVEQKWFDEANVGKFGSPTAVFGLPITWLRWSCEQQTYVSIKQELAAQLLLTGVCNQLFPIKALNIYYIKLQPY